MPTAIADGPGGLECKHTIGAIVLNDQAARPRYKLDRIAGLHSLPEADDERRPRTAMLGEVVYPSYSRGKTILYEGRVQATELDELRAMGSALRAACSDRSNEQAVFITPHASWGDDDWGYYARVMQLDMDDDQVHSPLHVRGPYQRSFILGMRMSDPRFYWRLAASAGLQSSGPHTSVQTLTNGGTAPSDPVFSIVVPGGTPDIVITDTDVPTSNGTARLRFNDVPAGTLVVDFRARTARMGSTDMMGYFDTVYNQWWDELIEGFRAGSNHVNVTGCTNWSVSWWPRSW